MEYIKENHWSMLTLEKPFVKTENKKRLDFIVTGNMKSTPVEIEYNNKPCWIKSSELEMFKLNNIDINNIDIVLYTEGLLSPLNEKSINGNAVDGYKVDVMYND